jgi:hypothetical protein
MAFTLALSEARAELIHLAAIDGKTGSNGRHGSTRLDSLLNRKYRMLLARAATLGYPHARQSATGTLGAALANEDFISLDIPDAAIEVVGVDVRGGHGSNKWEKLDALTWEQRRDVHIDRNGVRCDGVLPRHGVGFWAQRSADDVSGPTLTRGALAIWPTRLAGKAYTVYYPKKWTAITQDSHVFLLYDGWDEWLLNAAAMAVCQRDTNKRTNYDTARDAWLAADALLESGRPKGPGKFSPTPYGGIQL